METQSNSNINLDTSHPNITGQTITKEEKMNVMITKRINFQKWSTFPSLRKHEWKTAKAEREKNKLIINKYHKEKNHGI